MRFTTLFFVFIAGCFAQSASAKFISDDLVQKELVISYVQALQGYNLEGFSYPMPEVVSYFNEQKIKAEEPFTSAIVKNPQKREEISHKEIYLSALSYRPADSSLSHELLVSYNLKYRKPTAFIIEFNVSRESLDDVFDFITYIMSESAQKDHINPNDIRFDLGIEYANNAIHKMSDDAIGHFSHRHTAVTPNYKYHIYIKKGKNGDSVFVHFAVSSIGSRIYDSPQRGNIFESIEALVGLN